MVAPRESGPEMGEVGWREKETDAFIQGCTIHSWRGCVTAAPSRDLPSTVSTGSDAGEKSHPQITGIPGRVALANLSVILGEPAHRCRDLNAWITADQHITSWVYATALRGLK